MDMENTQTGSVREMVHWPDCDMSIAVDAAKYLTSNTATATTATDAVTTSTANPHHPHRYHHHHHHKAL